MVKGTLDAVHLTTLEFRFAAFPAAPREAPFWWCPVWFVVFHYWSR
jgi:hypothetical protein